MTNLLIEVEERHVFPKENSNIEYIIMSFLLHANVAEKLINFYLAYISRIYFCVRSNQLSIILILLISLGLTQEITVWYTDIQKCLLQSYSDIN